ncbi:MAG: CoA transferase [Pseudomonadota bacterium]
MTDFFQNQIASALGSDIPPGPAVQMEGTAHHQSCFAVSDLATASVAVATSELAALLGTTDAILDRRLASLWFAKTIQPVGWEMAPRWDPIAGAYRTNDGWIRLHTNAPLHRKAALSVLDCAPEASAVKAAVATSNATALESAIVAAGGAAAEMRALDDWQAHEQGRAVAKEPLIAWDHTNAEPDAKPLADVRILDLTRILAGPVCTRFLAGFGAQVLRLDPPWWNEPSLEPEVTIGKRRAGLDLSNSEDRKIFENLLAKADVLVTGYRPGALAAKGYDTATRRKIAPNLIEVSLNAFGHTGPWRKRRGFDSLVQMSAGIAHEGMIRIGGDRPHPLPVQALDHATGYFMAAAVLRALRRRNQTGQITSARLSLARTAKLLSGAGTRDIAGDPMQPKDADFDCEIEATDWGTAKRLRFPVRIDGQGPVWTHTAGSLRVDAAKW